MNSNDFYTLANNLLNNLIQPDEAMLRTVVGRAYYAVYLSTRDWVDQRFPTEISQASGASHERYVNCLYALQRVHFDLSFSAFARELKELKDKRHFADYEISAVQSKVDTQVALLQANKLINDLLILKNKYP